MSTSNYLRRLLVLACALSASTVFAQAVTAVEFYNKTLDAYFITGRVTEQLLLDGRTDFQRTGMTFEAVSAPDLTTNTQRICRFYISLDSPPTNSHFYGREGVDCEQLSAQNLAGFRYEGFDFAVARPQGGLCPAGLKAVYRAFRPALGGKTPNHRYMTSLDTYYAAQGQGYVGENAAFCVTGSTDVARIQDYCGTFYYPGRQISYQTFNSEGLNDTFFTLLNPVTTTFNGYVDVKALIERFQNAPTKMQMIIDSANFWSEIGSSTIEDTGLSEIYYSTPTVFPRNMSVGDFVNIDRQLRYSRPNTLGSVTQVGKVTYIGRENVAAPLGTFPSACKFSTVLVTTYSGSGQTVTRLSTDWVVNAIGIVRNVSAVKTESPNSPTFQITSTTGADYVQPF